MNQICYLVLLILLAAKHLTKEARNIGSFEKGGTEGPGKVFGFLGRWLVLGFFFALMFWGGWFFCVFLFFCSLSFHFCWLMNLQTLVLLKLKYILFQNVLAANTVGITE